MVVTAGTYDILVECVAEVFAQAAPRSATVRALDPYLVAALVAQESNFDPAVKSPANAVGLMQVMPASAGVPADSLFGNLLRHQRPG